MLAEEKHAAAMATMEMEKEYHQQHDNVRYVNTNGCSYGEENLPHQHMMGLRIVGSAEQIDDGHTPNNICQVVWRHSILMRFSLILQHGGKHKDKPLHIA